MLSFASVMVDGLTNLLNDAVMVVVIADVAMTATIACQLSQAACGE